MRCNYACGSSDHLVSRRSFLGGVAAGLGLASGFSGLALPAVSAELARKERQVLLLWLARRQPMVLIGAAVVGALSLGWVLYPYDTLGSSSSGLIVKYGVFATRVSRAGYYLRSASVRHGELVER